MSKSNLKWTGKLIGLIHSFHIAEPVKFLCDFESVICDNVEKEYVANLHTENYSPLEYKDTKSTVQNQSYIIH